jgi:hypothetical protein
MVMEMDMAMMRTEEEDDSLGEEEVPIIFS